MAEDIAGQRLDGLGLAYLDLILDEGFAILPPIWRTSEDPPYPQTVGELAQQTHQPVAMVMQQLQQIAAWAQDIAVESLEHDDDVIPLQSNPSADVSMCLNEEFARWLAAKRVVVLADDAGRAFSAAMFLRQKGLSHTFCLKSELTTGL